MFFPTKSEALAYARSQERDIPSLRGRLRVIADTATKWDRNGKPYFETVWTIYMEDR
jgi:hypothetical protein